MDYLTEFFRLDGKVAVITGAGGYLCSEMARSLSRAGVRVAVLDRDEKNISALASEIRAAGGTASFYTLDVIKKKNFESVFSDIMSDYGDVDILINGAGINAPTPFFDITLDEWHAILDVHLTGTLFGCQVFGKHMVQQQKGSIINISSASAGPPLSKAFTYSVAKAGIYNLTQNLAREWASDNVRVNALRPGFFPTEWSKTHFIDEERNRAILGHTPMKRYGRPEELCGAVLWLSSEAATFVTGALITVDGGFTAMTI